MGCLSTAIRIYYSNTRFHLCLQTQSCQNVSCKTEIAEMNDRVLGPSARVVVFTQPRTRNIFLNVRQQNSITSCTITDSDQVKASGQSTIFPGPFIHFISHIASVKLFLYFYTFMEVSSLPRSVFKENSELWVIRAKLRKRYT